MITWSTTSILVASFGSGKLRSTASGIERNRLRTARANTAPDI
jgi:hypothetical protein